MSGGDFRYWTEDLKRFVPTKPSPNRAKRAALNKHLYFERQPGHVVTVSIQSVT
jgi:hypothetical protein